VARQPAVQISPFTFMTFNAESHFESFSPNSIHGLDLSMAFFAFHLFFNVSLMVEQNVFRKIEDFFPGCRRSGVKIFMFLPDPGMIGDDVLVTVEAFFNRGDSRMKGPFHIRMAKPTLDHLDTGMDPMAERDRLFGTDSGCRRDVKKIEKAQNQQHAKSGP